MSQVEAVQGLNEKFPVHPYRADGGFRSLGVLNLLTTLAVAGAILGFAAHFVAQVFYLIILFPALIGFVLGFVGSRMVKSGHVRNPWIGVLAGLLGGIFAMLMMHYFDWQTFKTQFEAKVPQVKQFAALPPDELKELSRDAEHPDEFIAAVHAMNTLPAYMDFQAIEGVEISNHGSKGMNLGYIGSYIYWGVEILIVAFVTLAMVKNETAAPYCVACAKWKTPRVLGGITGDVSLAKQGIDNGDPAMLAQSAPVTGAIKDTMLGAHVCPDCNAEQSSLDLKLTRYSKNKDGKTTELVLANISWPGEAWPTVQALCANAAPAAEVPFVPPPPPASA